MISGLSYARGNKDASSSVAASISLDHLRPPTSKSSVPDASATSVARSPVRRIAHVVLRQEHRLHALPRLRLLSRTHSSFGSVNPVSAGLHVSSIRRAAPICAVSALALRVGPLIAPEQGRAARPRRLVEQHRAVHLPREAHGGDGLARQARLSPNAPRTAAPLARHQSRGSCSAQPVRGDANGTCSSVAEPAMRPVASMMMARVPPVPTSMPIRYDTIDELPWRADVSGQGECYQKAKRAKRLRRLRGKRG